MDGLRDHMAQCKDDLLFSDNKITTTNEMLVNFKTQLSAAVDKFIPSKMTKTNSNALANVTRRLIG